MKHLSLTQRRLIWLTAVWAIGLLTRLLKDVALGLSVDDALTAGFVVGNVQTGLIIGLALWLDIWRKERAHE